MDLAVIDSFARADVPPKSGGRPSDDASESSFSDMLDTRLREPEPVRERPVASEARADRRDADATRDARQAADTSKAAEPSAEPETDTPKSETVSAKPRVKPKSERDTNNGRDTAAEAHANEPAATPAPATKPATAKGAIAAVVAELLNGNTGDAAETPMGLLVAAVTPGATPQPVTAPQVLSLLTDAATVPVQPATTTPAATTPAAPAPMPNAATPAMPATPEFKSQMKAAAPETLPTAGTNTAPTAPQAQAPVMPDQVIAQAPAATAAVVAPAAAAAASVKADPAARAADAATIEAALEALAADAGEELLSTVTLSTAAQPAAAKPAPVLAAPSAYSAQIASQTSQAMTAEAPAAAPADVMKEVAPDAASSGKSVDLSELTEAGDDLTAVKPQELPSSHAASEPTATRATNSVEAAQRAAARPAAVPIAEQVAVRISKAVSDGVDRISVKLNPAELGQIEIRMEIGPDGKFNAVFAADRPQTVELLQRDARELARSLQDAGLRTDTGSLSFNLRGQNQNQAQNGTGAAGSHPGLGHNAGDLTGDAAPLPTGHYGASNAANGRVDIRV